jgi:two-component system, sensor histidine kinase and response regulator
MNSFEKDNLEKPYLLCLDDESHNLDALERIFRKKFNVLKAIDGLTAFGFLNSYPHIPIIISDQRMPEISGVEFLEKSINTHPDSIRILLTGYTDIESVIESVNKAQIYRYLTKPWDAIDLSNTVDQALEKFYLRKEIGLKNAELELAYNELKQLDLAKSQFMILINHELKTPLTTILSFTELLKETLLSEEQTLFLDRINKSSDKLKKIIDDVLLILKGELETIIVKNQTMNVAELLKQIPQEIQKNLKLKNQTLVEDFSFSDLTTDPHLLTMAFHRALHNATKFGLAQSHIEVKTMTRNNKKIISLFNKGPAISQSVINKIFQPFQLDENIMNHSVGMGLGLTICHTILKSLGGTLEIKNVTEGVEVTFILK